MHLFVLLPIESSGVTLFVSSGNGISHKQVNVVHIRMRDIGNNFLDQCIGS